MASGSTRDPNRRTPLQARLPARLRVLFEMIPASGTVADIGSGHGMLAQALQATGRAVIATERTAAAMERLRTELSRRGASVDCRQGEGFEAISAGEVETVVVAGMGGRRIIGILESAGWLPRWLVLQAVQDQDALAGWIEAGEWPAQMLVATERGRSYQTWRVATGT